MKIMQRFYLFITKKCNQNCLFCVRKGKNEEFLKEPTLQEIKTQIDEFIKKGGGLILLDGGEPTLRNDIEEILSYINGRAQVTILTNAVVLSNKEILKRIVRASGNNISFCVSLHSHIKEISDYLTQAPGTFKKTIEGIKNMIEMGLNVSIYFVITKQNYKHLKEFVEFLNKKFPQIKWLTFSFIFPQGNALSHPEIFPRYKDVQPYLNEALKVAEKYGIQVSFTTCGLMPFCMIEGYEGIAYRQMINDLKTSKVWDSTAGFREYELAKDSWHDETKIKSKSCDFCVLNFACKGVWKFYAKIYGTEELRPIFANEERIIKLRLDDLSLEDLIEKIKENSKKKIVFLDIKIKSVEKLKENVEKLVEAVKKLYDEDIFFRFLRPLPKFLFTKEVWEVLKIYLPKNCLECAGMYIEQNGELIGCWKEKVNLKNYNSKYEIFLANKNKIFKNLINFKGGKICKLLLEE